MHYLFVHGCWHGSWCWQYLCPLLTEKGHTTECVDLIAQDTCDNSAPTYSDYSRKLEHIITQNEEPIVIVAHSMAGMLVAPLLDKYSDHIAHVYYIAAIIPQQGDSLLDVVLRYEGSELADIISFDEVNNTQYLDCDAAKQVLYHDCKPEVQTWAVEQLRPEPFGPLIEKMTWQDSGKHAGKRTYITCQHDRDVSVALQHDMTITYPAEVINLECGHFPQLSHPELIADILLQKYI